MGFGKTRSHRLICTKAHWIQHWSRKKYRKKAYKTIIESDFATMSSGKKWSKILGNEFETNIHLAAFKDIYRVTTITKYRDFQFWLLQNKIFCNNVLYYWGIKDSQKCERCNYEKEDVTHMLWHCKFVKKVWQNIAKLLKTNDSTTDTNNWSLSSVIYNLVQEKPNHVVNYIVLVIKFYIFRAKCKGEKVCYQEALYEIITAIQIDEYNARKNNSMKKHSKRWNSKGVL